MHPQPRTTEPKRNFRKPPPTQQMHPADIKAALQKKGSSQAEIAHRLNKGTQTVSNVVNGRSTSRLIAQAIADEIGLTLDEIWPGRYPRLILTNTEGYLYACRDDSAATA